MFFGGAGYEKKTTKNWICSHLRVYVGTLRRQESIIHNMRKQNIPDF